MIKIILLTLILLLPLSVNAEQFTIFGGESEFSLAMGPDIQKDTGKTYGEFRYRETLYLFEGDGFWGEFWDEFGYSLYVGSMNTLGVDLYITHNQWIFGWGIEGAKRNTDVVDSTGGYELLIEYAFTEQWALSLKHRSNCRKVCHNISFIPKGDDELANGGFNFLMLRYMF